MNIPGIAGSSDGSNFCKKPVHTNLGSCAMRFNELDRCGVDFGFGIDFPKKNLLRVASREGDTLILEAVHVGFSMYYSGIDSTRVCFALQEDASHCLRTDVALAISVEGLAHPIRVKHGKSVEVQRRGRLETDCGAADDCRFTLIRPNCNDSLTRAVHTAAPLLLCIAM